VVECLSAVVVNLLYVSLIWKLLTLLDSLRVPFNVPSGTELRKLHKQPVSGILPRS